MAGKIQRTSGPQPLRERPDGEFTWMIPLNAVPSREWMKLFNTPRESSSVCMPNLVGVQDRGLVFAATEERIKDWIRHIDEWMATANEGVADAEARRLHAREREERGVEEAKQRVTDADKYRSL